MADLFGGARRRWRSAYGRLRDSEAPVTLLVVGIMLGLVLGLWLGRWWIPEGSDAAPDTHRAQLSEGPDRGPAAQRAHASRRDSTRVRPGRCERVYTAQVRPLAAAGPAMAQWETHIGAMNKLVVGAITLAQAQEFWDQTREGAATKLAAFGDAQRVFEQRTAPCPTPDGRTSQEVRGCAAAVGARRRELDRAAVALDTWREHVDHMEMLRRGEMSPEEATQMWLGSWREGSRQVAAYRNAARDAQRLAGSQRGDQGGADGPCAG